MRAKSRLLRWLTAIAVLMVTAYACVAAQARSADDLVRFHGSHFRSDKYRKSSLDTVSRSTNAEKCINAAKARERRRRLAQNRSLGKARAGF